MLLIDLFPAFLSSWPAAHLDTSFPPSTDGAGLALQFASAIEVTDFVTTVGTEGAVAVTGRLTLADGVQLATTQLQTHLFPKFGFTFAPSATWSSDFRVVIATDGSSTIQIDTLPVMVSVPADILSAHPNPERRVTDPTIVLSEAAADTTITRDFSLMIEGGGERIRFEPHLPISIGPCTLFGVPVHAIHELTLISAPDRARAQVDWLVREVDPGPLHPGEGALGFGGVELDWDEPTSPLRDLRDRLRLGTGAEVVLEDLVIPAVFFPPVPLHGSFGVRRVLLADESLEHFLTFEGSAVEVQFGNDMHAFLSRLFFRTPEEEEEKLLSGLTVEGGIAWAGGDDGAYEVELGLIDGDVARFSFAHVPGPLGDDVPLVRLDFWSVVVDIFRLRLGVSVNELRKTSVKPGSAIQALVDLLIREKPPGDQRAWVSNRSDAVKVKTEDGRPFEAALTDLGWDRGKPSGALVMPRGAHLEVSRFVFEVHELGLASESGATYISVSGAIRERPIPTAEGGVWFERLRGKLAGSPDAPGFKLGGIGFDLSIEDVVEIAARGSIRRDILPDGTRVEEQGLGGGLVIHVGKNEWGLALEVFWGTRTPPNGEEIDYFLLRVALFGVVPLGPFALRGIEGLYASNLMPKLAQGDRRAGELKYYSWLKRARPTAVLASRALDAWQPAPDSWALGLGFGVSITGADSVFQLKAFGAGFDSPTASGLIIVVEFGMFGAKKPLATGVFEYDFRSDAFVLVIPIEVTLDEIVDNFPKALKVRLGGTIAVGNRPGLVALGRLEDPATWVGGKLELTFAEVFTLKVRVGVCVEWLEDTHVGGGLTISVTVAGGRGPLRLEGWGALDVLLRFLVSGTNDFVARLRLELGFAIVLFRFLRYGISVEVLAEWMAHLPNYVVLRVTFRLETPWYLPDFSYSLEHVVGSLEPTARVIVTGALMQASASTPTMTTAIRVQRVDSGEGGAPLALEALASLGGTGAWRGPQRPVPLDARVEIDLGMIIVDRLGIGSPDADLGVQISGDGTLALTTRYSLIGLTMRRRPLAGGPWVTVEELSSAASPRSFRWGWDEDIRTNDRLAAKRLLLNGRTPFSVTVDSPLTDAEILDDDPAFPCCRVRRPDVARFEFTAESFGVLPDGFTRTFRYEDRGTAAPVVIRGTACAVVAATSGATADRVGRFAPTASPLATISASEDLAVCAVRLSVESRTKARLVIAAFDAEGEEVARHVQSVGSTPFDDVPLNPGIPFRTVVVWIEDLAREDGQPATAVLIILDSVECVTVADRERFEDESARCSRESSTGPIPVVNFLARHEYEIALTTEVAVRHTSTDWETTTVVERVGFTTSGAPGLNETPEPGSDLEPYVVSRAPGGRGLTYREEPVHIVLSDALRLFGPGAGTTEADARLPVIVVVESEFDANPAAHAGKGSWESAEWFLTNRGVADPWVTGATLGILHALTGDRAALRLRALSEASAGTCTPGEYWVEQQPGTEVEPFDPAGRPLWEPAAAYHAVLRLAGGPVVERAPFEADDLSAFTSTAGAWTVADGALTAAGAAAGAFGESDWDHYRVEVRGMVPPGGAIGVTVLVDPARAEQGVRAWVRRESMDAGALVVESATGTPFDSVALDGSDPAAMLTVEVFADAVRCRCGDAVVSVPRETRGPGGCVLLADSAAVTELRVRGIDLYRRPFHTSRYEGFAEHIGSCRGLERYDAGSSAQSVASVHAGLGGALAAVMTPDAPAADREARFIEVASALATPLREDPQRVHLTCAESPTDRWLLLETPEPLDLTDEIELRLERRVVHPSIGPEDKARLGAILEAALQAAVRAGRPGHELPGGLGARRLLVPDQLRGILDPPNSRRPVYRVEVVGRNLVLTGLATGETRAIRAPRLSPEDRALLDGVTIDLDAALRIVRWNSGPVVEWVEQPLTLIQDAPALHALLLPTGWSLPDGTYRLAMSITRPWFDTLDPVGLANAYLDSEEIAFELVG